jgi:hypothetical protein
MSFTQTEIMERFLQRQTGVSRGGKVRSDGAGLYYRRRKIAYWDKDTLRVLQVHHPAIARTVRALTRLSHSVAAKATERLEA